jgi:hypothetical protein
MKTQTTERVEAAFLRRPVALVVGALLCAVGCSFNPSAASTGAGATTGSTGGTGGSSAPQGLTALTISPPSASLTISGGGPAQMQQYKVTGTVNGHQQDMTSQVSYSTSPAGIVTVNSGGLVVTTGTSGGVVTVTATSGTVSATATLTVNYTFVGPDPGMTSNVPTSAPGLFTTTTNDASRAPQLVYPNDGVLFPPNVSGIEIHFMPGAGNTIFEVDLLGQISSVKSYIRCTAPAGINGCIYLPDPGLWASVAQSNAGQGQVQLFIRGTDDNGTSVGSSQTFHLQFSKDDIMGALYYWTTSGKTAIMRWDFGGSTKTAVQYLTPTNTDGSTCVGCHALSSDGTKLVASAGGQNDGRLLLWNVSTNMPQQAFPLMQKSQFESWSSDGTQFVGIYGDANPNHKGPVNLMLFDGNTGAITQTIDLGGLRADHPDWSKNTSGPDTIAFTSVDPTAPTTDQRPATGGIDFIQQTGGAWGQPQTLVPSQLGKNRYYPAIAPDGNLVIYNESTCTNGTPTVGQAPDKSCDADTDMTATIFLTSLDGSTPVALANANGPGVADMGATALTNSFPKWAPFIEQLDEMRQVVWLTFSSTRQYGLRSPPAPANTSETTKGTLIWMVGMVLGPGGADPSFTAFCLPFQDITTSNHIAQWAKTFVNIIIDHP